VKIKDTEIRIVEADISSVKADAIVNPADGELVMSEDWYAVKEKEKKFCAFGESQVRSNCRRVLEEASLKKARSIALPALGCGTGAFTAIASA
jgi:O-acetyl-ADP-ribose deacetylase (regulator of RNase III)